MSRMTAPFRVTGAAVAASALLSLWTAGPALAHGAPTNPVSRVYGCSPSGGSAGTAACRAATAASGGNTFVAWDNLRVAGVNGRDRQTIPDGKLCSGGLSDYKGLDLARADWPSTRLAPGGRLTMTYASTIAHTGTFKLYLTKPGYDPAKPLTWSDLPTRPFAQVTDPALTNGAYHIAAKLPSDRTGRQVLYTIWQNSSTPDTYYSCSDVVFSKGSGAGSGTTEERAGGAAATSAKPDSSKTGHPSGHASPSRSAAVPTTPAAGATDGTSAAPRAEDGAADSTPVASDTAPDGSGPSAPLLAGGAAAVLVLTGGAALALRLRRR
ncbi:lytic polysaccharide monooxygenase auxiliary activity family 9 protein [Streptomyces olivochromogenes]|uniref:lytic polysaccharide monooxygenase auxiliary activity family 9 protein n=1 Tax=Streptomyces olivochromogenes TaxID=1963 RepID=UPI001F3C5EF2|nr:lytic polysaccharide monooxygenase [Streptomyces olivochromogenes]MCF3135993.1 lytic polysaccharide monooxygenase [Streptomyces olivochromogenes]